jgi:hypothetical protein
MDTSSLNKYPRISWEIHKGVAKRWQALLRPPPPLYTLASYMYTVYLKTT